MSKTRLGFCGTGWIGRHRMAAMLDTGLVTAAAIVEPAPEMLADALKLAPDTRVVPDLDALLALDLDGIVIATPSALHAEQSIRALEAGMAVFCQKPLGRDAAEAVAVVDAARRADRLLSVDFSYRFTSGMQAIASLIRDGALGRVHAVDLTFHNAYGPDKPWFYDRARSGGGCVMDLGVHLVDLALWVLGFPEIDGAVAAQLLSDGQRLAPDGVEDYAGAQFGLASGTVVRLTCSWRLHAGRDSVIEAAFYGSDGGAALRNVGGSFYDFTAERFDGTTAETIATDAGDWGGRAAADWARRLAAGERFAPDAADLVQVSAALDAIYAA